MAAKKSYDKELQAKVKAKRKEEIADDTPFTKVDKVNALIAGEEDKGPSAAPKVQLPGPLVTPGKKLRQQGLRPAKTSELNRGVVAASTGIKPARQTKVGKTTKSGKKIDPTTGKVRVPRQGEAANIDGQVVRVTPENQAEAAKAARTTVLPTVMPEPEKVRPVLSASTHVMQGFATSNPEDHSRLVNQTGQAWTHLGRMQKTFGTSEFHTHHQNFNEVHAHISGYDKSLGGILKIAHNAVMNPEHPDSAKAFTLAKQASGDRIKAGLDAAAYRKKSQQAADIKRFGSTRQGE